MQDSQRSIVVIGNFDGVHSGHRGLIERARELSDGRPVVAVTFWPHPQAVIHPGTEPLLLTDLHQRIDLLRDAGADEVRVVTFDHEVMGWSPAEFVERVIDPLHPAVVVVGTNFHFGSRAAGTVETLRELGAGRFDVVATDLVTVGDEGTCSSAIRKALADGDVELAAQHLGRPFRYVGVVVMGHQRGRDLGFPTANLPTPPGFAVPADGVYAGWATRLDQPGAERWPAAISVGTNPTFDDVRATVVEAHVLDRDDLELYGIEIAVDFVARLRGNVKFESLDALIAQIGADVAAARSILLG
ncbi:bifunctional riboflavin kinase/FAD synthetase [Aestuariimicrobium ganziense]|uniref:bifunctional riboflavin kinase/FAD synthetase n=1 Tax=Aestuariimicrobium ganziense TaxID=2773677 RepID=UPI002E28385A|nr:bifunctional riboflavin kinase/FAD synthetase [Aestuariimicrobium ganziense]